MLAFDDKKIEKIKTLLQDPISIRAERCRRDFFFFVKEFWSEIIAEEPVWNWHIPYLCKELELVAFQAIARQPKLYDLIINIPPGTTKSTICTVMFPVWCWIARLPKDQFEERYKRKAIKLRKPVKKIKITGSDLRFITGSYSAPLSLEHAEYSRDIVRSDKYRAYFPEIEIRLDKDLKSNYKTNLGGSRFSTSVGAAVTGVHGHIIIIDDPIDPEKSLSEADRPKANRWMDRTLSTRKVNKANTCTILIQQRLHQEDCTGHQLKKNKGKVKHICLPGTDDYEIKPKKLKKKYVNGLLDPIRLSRSVLKELEEDLGPYGYSGQIGQNPIPREGRLFERDKVDVIEDFNPNRIKQSIRFWDKAGTEDGGKRTYGVLMHEMKRGPYKYVIADCQFGQWKAIKREKRIKQAAKIDGYGVKIGIEQEPGSGGKESAENTISNLSGYIVLVDKPTGDKFTRAEPFSVQFNAGNVAVLNKPWTEEYLGEMEVAGPGAAFLDAMDASSGAFNMLSRPTSRGGTW